jgi:hypothetical protein
MIIVMWQIAQQEVLVVRNVIAVDGSDGTLVAEKIVLNRGKQIDRIMLGMVGAHNSNPPTNQSH